jgi:NhaA family Na+:H+ antiporter
LNETSRTNRLDRPVTSDDHVLGPDGASITLVEYGSYACPYCRAANEHIADIRDQLGTRLRYVFRHRPLRDNDLARRAAILVECAPDIETFWDAHIKLMSRSETLTDEDLEVVAADLSVPVPASTGPASELVERARRRVDADERSSHASGVMIT